MTFVFTEHLHPANVFVFRALSGSQCSCFNFKASNTILHGLWLKNSLQQAVQFWLGLGFFGEVTESKFWAYVTFYVCMRPLNTKQNKMQLWFMALVNNSQWHGQVCVLCIFSLHKHLCNYDDRNLHKKQSSRTLMSLTLQAFQQTEVAGEPIVSVEAYFMRKRAKSIEAY